MDCFYTINMGIIWCCMNFGIMGKAVIAASSNIPMPFSNTCVL